MAKTSHENTISDLLIYLLQERGEVCVHGIGTFRLIQSDARIDPNNSTIHAPQQNIIFTTEIDPHTTNLLDWIKNEDILKPKKLKSVEKAIQQKVNELINLGTFELKGIGSISESDDNQWDVSGFNDYLAKLNSYLPVLSLPDRVVAPRNEKNLEATEQEISSMPKMPTRNGVQLEKRSRGIAWDKILIPLVIFGLGIAAILYSAQFFRGQETVKNNQSESNEGQADPVIVKDTLPLDNLEYGTFLTPDILNSGCLIVIGSFDRLENAQKMKSDLASSNYQIEVISDNGTNRVVIRFDCSELDLKEQLLKVRSEVNAEAWYLVPDIDDEDLGLTND